MKQFLTASLCALALMAGSASAAPLVTLFGTSPVTLPVASATCTGTCPYNPTPSTSPDAVAGDTVQDANAPNEGLKLDATANLIFTFLGKEAGFVNVVYEGLNLFNNNAAIGTSVAVNDVAPNGGGFVPFKFISNGVIDVVNGNVITANYASIAFKILSVTDNTASVIAFLNDHYTGDADWDDMVVQIDFIRKSFANTEVPLPAGLMLLLSGLAGLGFMGRLRAKAA